MFSNDDNKSIILHKDKGKSIRYQSVEKHLGLMQPSAKKKKKKILCSAGLKAEIEPPKLDFNKFVGHGAQTHFLPVKQPKGE